MPNQKEVSIDQPPHAWAHAAGVAALAVALALAGACLRRIDKGGVAVSLWSLALLLGFGLALWSMTLLKRGN